MNRNSAVYKIADRLWTELADWFTAARYFNEDSFVTRLRYFQITAFCFLFTTSFLNFISNFGMGYVITSVACLGLIIVRYLIDTHQIRQAYYLMLGSINMALILLTYTQGLGSGVFLFFFPCIISFSFLTDASNKKSMFFTYLIGIGSFLAAICFAPDSIVFHAPESGINTTNFFINVILSFLLVFWMSHTLAKENFRKQTVLKNKEVFLNTIFNSSLHTEIIVDAETGLISNCNEHAAALFAVTNKNMLLHSSASDLFLETQKEEGSSILVEWANKEANWEGELTCIRKDQTGFPGSITVVPFWYHDKLYRKITIVDITEKSQILFQLQMAKKKAEELAYVKTQFLSHMSHELRTPLNGIIGSTNLLLQDTFLPEQKDQLSVLKFSSEHMLNLINDILDLSKLEADRIQLEKAVVDIPKFITKVIAPFTPQFEEKEVSFEVEVDEKLKRSVLADPTRLNQVLTNLLSNALKFTSKGSVKLAVKAVKVNSDSMSMEFSVTDSGIGISEENKAKIFEQFTQADVKTTRKYGGTGLGLAISQKLVYLMGGELKVDSKYHKGSSFYFEVEFPVHNSQKKAYISSGNVLKNDKQLKGVRVLIAEDNPINMMIASRFLDKWGVSYEKAKNGLEAVNLFGKGEFDVVLMDLEMPEMDGYGALDAIRKLNAGIPAIAFTAAVFDNMKENLSGFGFNDYLQKPFRPEDLQSKLVAFSAGVRKSA